MTINKSTIYLKYLPILSDNYRKVNLLSEAVRHDAIEYVKQYYHYLQKKHIFYAKLALDVINITGLYGKLFAIHLKTQSIFEQISPESIPTIREKIIIGLAYHDAKMRSDDQYDVNKVDYALIEKYHIEEFKKYATPYAWIGFVITMIYGSGSWVKCATEYNFDTNIITPLLHNKSPLSIFSQYDNDEYLTRRCVSSLAFSFELYHKKEYSKSIFIPIITSKSQEYVAYEWQVCISRILEIPDQLSRGNLDASKKFAILPADYFLLELEKNGDKVDYILKLLHVVLNQWFVSILNEFTQQCKTILKVLQEQLLDDFNREAYNIKNNLKLEQPESTPEIFQALKLKLLKECNKKQDTIIKNYHTTLYELLNIVEDTLVEEILTGLNRKDSVENKIDQCTEQFLQGTIEEFSLEKYVEYA